MPPIRARYYSEDESVAEMNDQQQQNQWRVTFYEKGEEPLVENMRTFADAWAVAQPYPDDDGLAWRFAGVRAQIKARFEAGERSICVCWVEGVNETRTLIELL